MIALDRTAEAAAEAGSAGLLGRVGATSDKQWMNAVRILTRGRGVDIAFDCVGGELFEPMLSTLAHDGLQIAIVSVGARRVSFDLVDFYHGRLALLGVDSRALTVSDCARVLDSLRPLFEAGNLKTAAIAKRGAFADAAALYAHAGRGGRGKAVFVMP